MRKLPKELARVMVPPKDLTRAVLALGPRVTDPRYLTDEKRRQGYVAAGEVHDAYWDWCLDEQQRRFKIFFEQFGRGLGPESHIADFRWRLLALNLAERHFPGLRLPDPYKRGRKSKTDETLQLVDAARKKAGRPISEAAAIRSAKVNPSTYYKAKALRKNSKS